MRLLWLVLFLPAATGTFMSLTSLLCPCPSSCAMPSMCQSHCGSSCGGSSYPSSNYQSSYPSYNAYPSSNYNYGFHNGHHHHHHAPPVISSGLQPPPSYSPVGYSLPSSAVYSNPAAPAPGGQQLYAMPGTVYGGSQVVSQTGGQVVQSSVQQPNYGAQPGYGTQQAVAQGYSANQVVAVPAPSAYGPQSSLQSTEVAAQGPSYAPGSQTGTQQQFVSQGTYAAAQPGTQVNYGAQQAVGQTNGQQTAVGSSVESVQESSQPGVQQNVQQTNSVQEMPSVEQSEDSLAEESTNEGANAVGAAAWPSSSPGETTDKYILTPTKHEEPSSSIEDEETESSEPNTQEEAGGEEEDKLNENQEDREGEDSVAAPTGTPDAPPDVEEIYDDATATSGTDGDDPAAALEQDHESPTEPVKYDKKNRKSRDERHKPSKEEFFDTDRLPTQKCNNEKLRRIMAEKMVGSPSASKQLVYSAVRNAFGQPPDVICSRSSFSYIVVSSPIYCEFRKAPSTCFVYFQP